MKAMTIGSLIVWGAGGIVLLLSFMAFVYGEL